MCRYVNHVSVLQTKPPILPTDRRIGSVLWDSVTRLIRSLKGTVTLIQFMHSNDYLTYNVKICVKSCLFCGGRFSVD